MSTLDEIFEQYAIGVITGGKQGRTQKHSRTAIAAEIKVARPQKATQALPNVLGAQTPWPPINEVEAYNAGIEAAYAAIAAQLGITLREEK